MAKRRRLPPALWAQRRRMVWLRDGGRCQGPHCRGAAPIPLAEAQIDHIRPVSRGGSHRPSNLRVLCARCHALRADAAHRGLIQRALAAGLIPPDWRALVWEET
jgi:5-methylcytosine-specific restriction enzyme A